MCGIAGLFDPSLLVPQPELLKDMLAAIRHRGPDDEGIHCDGGVGLAASRLSILDLSPAGHQPMLDEETGNWIVYNGEVYNYRELRDSLGLTGLRSQTDTEVILKAYAKLGPDCVRQFNGMYAFCIWDAKRRRLFCVRDRLGIKPFFYAFHRGVFYFASEIKSLLQAHVPRAANMGTIYEYLVYGVYDHSEETFFDGIRQLPAGHTLTVEPGGAEVSPYWNLGPELEASGGKTSVEAAAEKFLELLTDSIRLRLRSDVPIAVHVSGGLDSTLMLAVLNKVNGGQGALKAFSYYYGEERYDEKRFVEELVRRAGWEVEYQRVSSTEIPELAQKAMWYQEQPYPGVITLAKHKLIEASHRFGAKVIMEGQGGDEIGGGYQYYFGPYVLDLIQAGDGERALAEIGAFGRQNGLTPDRTLALVVNGLASYYRTGRSADGTPFVKAHCLDPAFVRQHTHELEFPRPFRSNLLNMQYRDIRHTKLPRILRSCDRASMAYGRELRVPFLDYRLVEFTFSMPGEVKIGNGAQRLFMREALRSFFPSRLGDIPKRAVVDPQREWLKRPLSQWVQDVFASRSFRERGILNAGAVEREYQVYRSAPAPENSFFLWQWLNLELWFGTFID